MNFYCVIYLHCHLFLGLSWIALFITCAEEKKERIEGEKMILSKLEESATALKDKMVIAKAERIANVQELRAHTD